MDPRSEYRTAYRVLDKQLQPKGQRLILLVDQDSAKAIRDRLQKLHGACGGDL
jgi:hypothetical protein